MKAEEQKGSEETKGSGAFSFPRSHRLGGVKAFRAVFDAGVRVGRGPLTIYVLPNDLGHPRLGLTVPRRVGKAHERVAIKRRLREAYRHLRHDLPAWDVVLVVRPHPLKKPAEYGKLIAGGVERLRGRVA